MKIFLIYGEQDTGKSTVCRRLFSALKGLDATIDYYERFEWGDFKSILTLNGVKIAIYSAGDEKQHLLAAREFGQTRGCDLLISAVRYHTHYNETLEDLTCEKDFFWLTLDKGADPEEMNSNENLIAFDLLYKISEIINH
ncbi:MAG: ATP-binding protein [Muribaculaceae bacterium]|nr:ATP-binding protein [Muribaculaceae bacterium]